MRRRDGEGGGKDVWWVFVLCRVVLKIERERWDV